MKRQNPNTVHGSSFPVNLPKAQIPNPYLPYPYLNQSSSTMQRNQSSLLNSRPSPESMENMHQDFSHHNKRILTPEIKTQSYYNESTSMRSGSVLRNFPNNFNGFNPLNANHVTMNDHGGVFTKPARGSGYSGSTRITGQLNSNALLTGNPKIDVFYKIQKKINIYRIFREGTKNIKVRKDSNFASLRDFLKARKITNNYQINTQDKNSNEYENEYIMIGGRSVRGGLNYVTSDLVHGKTTITKGVTHYKLYIIRIWTYKWSIMLFIINRILFFTCVI